MRCLFRASIGSNCSPSFTAEPNSRETLEQRHPFGIIPRFGVAQEPRKACKCPCIVPTANNLLLRFKVQQNFITFGCTDWVGKLICVVSNVARAYPRIKKSPPVRRLLSLHTDYACQLKGRFCNLLPELCKTLVDGSDVIKGVQHTPHRFALAIPIPHSHGKQGRKL